MVALHRVRKLWGAGQQVGSPPSGGCTILGDSSCLVILGLNCEEAFLPLCAPSRLALGKSWVFLTQMVVLPHGEGVQMSSNLLSLKTHPKPWCPSPPDTSYLLGPCCPMTSGQDLRATGCSEHGVPLCLLEAGRRA